jgi:hypothetical protein
MHANNRDICEAHANKFNIPLPLTQEELAKKKNFTPDPFLHQPSCWIAHFDETTGKRQLMHCLVTEVDRMIKECEMDKSGDYVHLGYVYNTPDEIQWPENCPVPHWDDIDCHRITDGKIHMCPIKTKKVMVEKLRPLRESYFKNLDAQFIRNLEEGKDNSEIIRKKKILRDMPTHPIWDKCKTLDDFKSISVDQLFSTSTQ